MSKRKKEDLGSQHPEMFEKILNQLKGKPKKNKYLVTDSDRASLKEFLNDVSNNHFDEMVVGEHIFETPVARQNEKTGEWELQVEEIPKPIKRKYAPSVTFYAVMEYKQDFIVSKELQDHVQILMIDGWYPYIWVKVYSTKDFRPLDTIQKFNKFPMETLRSKPVWVYAGESDIEKECQYLFRNRKFAFREDITV